GRARGSAAVRGGGWRGTRQTGAVRRALHRGGREVVIVRRMRLAPVLAALAAVVGLASGLVLVGIGVVSSPSLASEAAPELLAVPEIATSIEHSLAVGLAAA